MQIIHGQRPDGTHIALISGTDLSFDVVQMPVHTFEVGDRIGWSPGDSDMWTGVITLSEPEPDGQWRLAWINENEPGKTFHWIGRRTIRDSRWYIPHPYEIEELP